VQNPNNVVGRCRNCAIEYTSYGGVNNGGATILNCGEGVTNCGN
jgi:hypothetical protein